MKKSTRLASTVGLIAFFIVLVFAATAIAQKDKRDKGGMPDVEDWVIMTYIPDNGYTVPVPLPVTKSGGGVAFDFYPTPDRAMLLSSDKDSIKELHAGNLKGKSLSAKISIVASPGATFNYFNNDGTGSLQGGSADPGGFVRLYFQTGKTTGWDPDDYKGNAQYWWSNPIHIDLIDLAARGENGITLQVPLDPDSWSDRDGHMGTDKIIIDGKLYDHTKLFNKATDRVTKVGLSFGGDGWFAFGCGVNAPSTAVFKLNDFKVIK